MTTHWNQPFVTDGSTSPGVTYYLLVMTGLLAVTEAEFRAVTETKAKSGDG